MSPIPQTKQMWLPVARNLCIFALFLICSFTIYIAAFVILVLLCLTVSPDVSEHHAEDQACSEYHCCKTSGHVEAGDKSF